jgi:hypothetical protein
LLACAVNSCFIAIDGGGAFNRCPVSAERGAVVQVCASSTIGGKSGVADKRIALAKIKRKMSGKVALNTDADGDNGLEVQPTAEVGSVKSRDCAFNRRIRPVYRMDFVGVSVGVFLLLS